MITPAIKRNVARLGLRTVVVAVVLAMVSGCTAVTFKRGASPGAMVADELACREDNTTETAYRSCMRNKGWFVAGGSTAAAPSATSQSDGAGTASSPASKVIDFSPPRAEPDIIAAQRRPRQPSEMPAQPPLPATSSVATSATPRQRPSSAAVVSAPRPAPVAAVAASTTSAASADPTLLVSVASWWKLGGTAAGLDADIDSCTSELGDDHRPAPAATRVSRAMGGCLRERGWYAIGK